jgi:hypothetical protein
MSDHPSSTECGDHGTQPGAFVCQHLPGGQGLGFHQGFDPEDPGAHFPDGWCDACEAVRATEGDWTERAEAFAGIRVICSACYLKVRLLNWPRSTHTNLAKLVQRSTEYLRDKQEILTSEYHINDHERFDWYQESGQLVFSNRGVPGVVADIQFVGSVSTRSNTWLWSWANESFLEGVRSQARQVRAYGDQNNLLKLACAYWSAEEADGWQMVAVAAYLLKAKGAYRSPDGHGFTFMVITDVKWVQ